MQKDKGRLKLKQSTDDRAQLTEKNKTAEPLQTQKMEVHHHPHVAKKNFKEYFLEFLMIFLAVTMGFFAENVREHFTEKAKGKEYIKSFVEDLSSDTAEYNKIIKELNDKDSALKNMDNCFDTLQKRMVFTNSLRNIIRNSIGFTDFIYTDRTIQQIKSAGGLQLIQNNEIEKYDFQRKILNKLHL